MNLSKLQQLKVLANALLSRLISKIKLARNATNIFSSKLSQHKGENIEKLFSIRESVVCHDIKSWCAEHKQGTFITTHPGYIARRKLPKTIENKMLECFKPLQDFACPERLLVSVKEATVMGKQGIIRLPTSEIVGELVAISPQAQKDFLSNKNYIKNAICKKVVQKYGIYYPLGVIGFTNYYHWLHDSIIRLIYIAELLPQDIRFIVPEGLAPFQEESLLIAGIEHQKIEKIPNGEAWRCSSIIFSTPILKTPVDYPEPLIKFRDRVETFYSEAHLPVLADLNYGKRLYLSRSKDGHFVAINEDEVVNLLVSFGFNVVFPGEMSLREQFLVFSHAEVIVGTGTGLFNMIYARKPIKVLQFQIESYPVNALWTLAEALGHEYWFMMTKCITNKLGGEIDNMQVPIEKLQQTLDAMNL